MNTENKTCPLNLFESMDKALAPQEVMATIYQRTSWFSYVNDRLEYKEYVMPGNTGDDLETLLSWYVNKTKYKVRYAGMQLRKAFPGLPPVEQRRVGKALLLGPKSDVEWVCKRLDTRKPEWDKDWIVSWHPSYSDLLESAWVKYKSKYCGRLLIQFMGKDVIRKHLDDLLGDDELYFSLCRRLVMEPWFSLDKHRLGQLTNINEYLSIMSLRSDLLSDDEAKRLLYQWIGTVSAEYKEERFVSKDKHMFWSGITQEHRVINAWGFDTALFYLLKMGKQNVVSDFLAWDEKVYQAYHSSINSVDDDYENHDKFVDLVLENLPEGYVKFRFPNNKCYDFLFRVDHPFTEPRVNFLYRREAKEQPAYFDSLEDRNKAYEPEHIVWNEGEDPLMGFIGADGLSDLPY